MIEMNVIYRLCNQYLAYVVKQLVIVMQETIALYGLILCISVCNINQNIICMS